MYQEDFSFNEQRELLSHFSNHDNPIFVIITPHQVDRGALMSRYSRSDKTMRRIFIDEFLSNPNRGLEFYNKVLLEYGDDSVAELGTVQCAIEWISNISAQKIEDHRIGMSFLEKSSRYVALDKKIDGSYKYYKDEKIMSSSLADNYIKSCDLAFETYSKNLLPMQSYLKEKVPINDLYFYNSEIEKETVFDKLKSSIDIQHAKKIYNSSIKSKSLDILRNLLPASTFTNLAITGNGRALEYLLFGMISSESNELKILGNMLYDELEKFIKPFIKRSKDKYSTLYHEYLNKTRNSVQEILNNYVIKNYSKDIQYPFFSDPNFNNDSSFIDVKLLDYLPNHEAEIQLTSSILHEYSNDLPVSILLDKVVSKLPEYKRHEIIRSYTQFRANRRHKPGRAYEILNYSFELITNFGIFRDLHRHRMLTIARQLLSTKYGFDVPKEVYELGIEKEYKDCMYTSNDTYKKLCTSMPVESQYVVNFAYRYPYFLKMNLREACHMIELRTTPQGHPDYRNVCQQMYSLLKQIHPVISEGIKFADMNKYDLERFKSEKNTALKKYRLTKKKELDNYKNNTHQ